MNTKHKLAVFDLDGTLLDTLQDLTNSVNYTMAQLSLDTYTAQQVRKMIGNGVKVLMQRALTSLNAHLLDRAVQLQREFYLAHNGDNTRPYDGVCQMLLDLKTQGVTVYVHTNKDIASAQKLCDKFFDGLIDGVCGTVTFDVTKPNVSALIKTLTDANVSYDNAVYCGDSEVDLASAFNLGATPIAVTWGFRDRQTLAQYGAKHFADTTRQVTQLALQLLG